jgi:hypothetical protein
MHQTAPAWFPPNLRARDLAALRFCPRSMFERRDAWGLICDSVFLDMLDRGEPPHGFPQRIATWTFCLALSTSVLSQDERPILGHTRMGL